MQADQSVIAPMQDAFTAGDLVMTVDIVNAVGQAVPAWGSFPLNRWLIVASVVLFALSLGSFYHIFPHLFKCHTRWRWNFTLEASMQLARMRNFFAFMMITPFCLIVSRYDILQIDIIKQYVPREWMTGAIIGVLLLYMLVRLMTYGMISSRSRQSNTITVAHKTSINFFVVLTLLMVLTTGILFANGAEEGTFRTAILLEMVVLYVVMILWEGEILLGSCNPLTTFLYLCALEFVPTGLLIAANICL